MRRPEVKSATIEFIAPAEYMVSHVMIICQQTVYSRLCCDSLHSYFLSVSSQ